MYTASQLIKLNILQLHNELTLSNCLPDELLKLDNLTGDQIDDLYDTVDELYDAENEIRIGDIETNISPKWSRYYETKSVASCFNGQWVGWTYYYGGGKHGEPDAIEWINDAYLLNLDSEIQVIETKRMFSKVS